MKRTLLLLFAGTLAQSVLAQSVLGQTFLSVQYEVAEPTENFRQAANTGFGVKAVYMNFVSPRFAMTGSIGYTSWGSRAPFNNYKYVAIPVHLGTDFLLSRGVIAPYIGMSLGMDYVRTRGANSTANSDKSELKFGFKSHIGVGIFVGGLIGVLLAGSYNITYTNPASKFFSLDAGLAVAL